MIFREGSFQFSQVMRVAQTLNAVFIEVIRLHVIVDLELGHVNRLGFDFVAILHSFCNASWKRCHALNSRGIFKNFGLVFSYAQINLHIKNLTAFVTCGGISSTRDCSAINCNLFDPLGVCDFLKCRSLVTILPAWFTFFFIGSGFLLPMWILRRWEAAILGIAT